MIILDATTKSLQFKLAGAVTTNQLPFAASYVDTTGTATTPGEQDGTSNSTTAVTVVSAPASNTQRLVKNIVIQNADTAAATVTVIYNNNSTLRNIFVTTLAVGDQLVYEDGNGWICLDKNGNIKTTGGVSLPNVYQATPANPTATSSNTLVMAGLAGSLTPNTTGKVMVVISGIGTNNSTGGFEAQISYGTGTAPVNGAALAGTQVGNVSVYAPSVAGTDIPFTCIAIISGLTLATAYWIDLAFARASAAGSTLLGNLSISAYEIK
jgi:hypothetical protein